jgi:hypothetical protein
VSLPKLSLDVVRSVMALIECHRIKVALADSDPALAWEFGGRGNWGFWFPRPQASRPRGRRQLVSWRQRHSLKPTSRRI